MSDDAPAAHARLSELEPCDIAATASRHLASHDMRDVCLFGSFARGEEAGDDDIGLRPVWSRYCVRDTVRGRVATLTRNAGGS